jgi:hypothetical protein
MKHLSSYHVLASTSKKFVESPEEFFEKPEAVLKLNIVEVVTMFREKFNKYFILPEPSIVRKDLSTVVCDKNTVLLDEKNKPVKFEDFFKHQGKIFKENGVVLSLSLNYALNNYYFNSDITQVIRVMILLMESIIARYSKWDSEVYREKLIEDLIIEQEDGSPKYNAIEVMDFIEIEADIFFINLKQFIHGKDWNIFTVELEGYDVLVKRYGDWRAFKYSYEQYNESQRELQEKFESEHGTQ